MDPLYPLRFRPVLRRYLWGGRRLATHLDKTLGPGDDYAESWEICDRGPEQSIVVGGPLAGSSLGKLVAGQGAALLGRHHPQAHFPLMLKFIDAARPLSIQVHPADAQAARLDPPDAGKYEAFVVLFAEPGSTVYAGLQPGVDRQSLAEAVRQGRCAELLHCFEPAAGDCVFLPPGTVHALGQGILVAEIQQASEVTFRLFDWNRLGADGRPRPLHVQQALDDNRLLPRAGPSATAAANGPGGRQPVGRVRAVLAGPLRYGPPGEPRRRWPLPYPLRAGRGRGGRGGPGGDAAGGRFHGAAARGIGSGPLDPARQGGAVGRIFAIDSPSLRPTKFI